MGIGDDLQQRLIEFAVNVMRLSNALPKSFAGRHIGEQLCRSGTACAANYAEVRGAESKNDFVHKLGIVRKELNESLVWLQILQRQGMISGEIVDALCTECDELCRIISASRKTAQTNARHGSTNR